MSADSAAVPLSLPTRELLYRLAPVAVSRARSFPGLTPRKPDDGNSNRFDDCGNGEKSLQQWHGVDLEDTTSNLAVSLAAILATELGDDGYDTIDRPVRQEQANSREQNRTEQNRTGTVC
jgi:hypothetical protein